MVTATRTRAHVITGGFPPGQPAGHDIDFARMRLLEILEAEEAVLTTTANDFVDVQKWLHDCQFLITYVSGPFADDPQAAYIQEWLEAGGRWLALHGSTGGKAARVGEGPRRMVKGAHHKTLGGFFINHPPVRRLEVKVVDTGHRLTQGVPDTFSVIDEPYMIELQDPESTHLLLTTEFGVDPSPPGFGFAYDEDTSLLADGKTRALGFIRDVGKGGVTYFALGHCHNPTTNSQPFVDESVHAEGITPTVLRDTWESEAYMQLLRNGIAWGLDR